MRNQITQLPGKNGKKNLEYSELLSYSGIVMLAVLGITMSNAARADDQAVTPPVANSVTPDATNAGTPAATSGAPNALNLGTIDVSATGVSNMDAASVGDVTHEELMAQPLLRPGALLENVPGLIVTQHSGEGKANQYFLRGFNLDHGTDLATEVDDMPINMPSHAHGQGYTDLNFLIPEMVGDLRYKKGPYYADEGDFATAGAVRMSLSDQVDTTATVGYGQDGYKRGLLMGTTKLGSGTLTSAGEVYHNDGPWVNPDDYNRQNAELRYVNGTKDDYYTITGMTYYGKWNSTDQMPTQAVDEGLASYFGTLAPTDGGQSSRSSLSFVREKQTENTDTRFSAYVIRYKFDLWSTFIYDLYTPDTDSDALGLGALTPAYQGQMEQHEDRVVYGFKGAKTWFTELGGIQMKNLAGVQARIDDIGDIGINNTIDRQFLSVRQDASIVESNGAVFFENSTQWRPDVRTVLGLRDDTFTFDVKDKMLNADGTCTGESADPSQNSDPQGCNTGSKTATKFNPKLGIVLGPWASTTFFLDLADGYHSNDARGITRDPAASATNPFAADPVSPLTRARSAEIGMRSTPLPQWETEVDLFDLKLNSELVFDGDAGGTDANGASTRYGIELSNRFHFTDYISGNLDGSFTHARFDSPTDDDLGCGDIDVGSPAYNAHLCSANSDVTYTGRYIPNSPTMVINAGLNYLGPTGWFGSLRARSFGASPMVEDDSIKSPAYTTLDAGVGYQEPKQWRIAVDVFNLLDKKWDDIDYYYAYRLPGQEQAVQGNVPHPGVPRTIRAMFTYYL